YGDFSANTLQVNGTLEFTAAYATSDRRWKKDLLPVVDALAGLRQLEGKSYSWRRDEFPDQGFPEGRQFGLVAQEVEKIFPELVRTDASGFKSVAYTQVVPLLIEAVKEQQDFLEKQNRTIASLLRRIEALEKK
ncbi:MAG: tail fiber domain-containing protein, partial [Deltaproteobacteria bacterium]|nr:tail fiber domain-containing protein [Deltaproteobacteria bacterium]